MVNPMPGRTILVVDDREDSLSAWEEILTRQGYSVLTARTMEQAKQMLATPGNAIGLVLSDYHLDADNLGTTIALWMKENGNPAPFILMSNSAETGEFSRMIQEKTIQGFWSKRERKALLEMVAPHMSALATEQSDKREYRGIM